MLEVSQQDVGGVTEVVWGSMLELEVRPCPLWAGAIEDERLVAHVDIRGAWNGRVELGCPPALLREVAGAVFCIAPEEAGRAQVREALAELVNMTAGNLKALLPEPCELGLPVVDDDLATRPAFALDAGHGSAPEQRVLLEAGFACLGYVFFVRVVSTGAASGRSVPA
jgi:hypothetical protein